MVLIAIRAAVAAALLLSSTAFAATGDFSKIDANADGKVSLEEGIKLHPDWTESAFKVLDTNADGFFNELEYETAVTASPAENDPVSNSSATSTQSTSQPTATAPAASVTLKAGPASYLEAVGANHSLECGSMRYRLTSTRLKPIRPRPN